MVLRHQAPTLLSGQTPLVKKNVVRVTYWMLLASKSIRICHSSLTSQLDKESYRSRWFCQEIDRRAQIELSGTRLGKTLSVNLLGTKWSSLRQVNPASRVVAICVQINVKTSVLTTWKSKESWPWNCQWLHQKRSRLWHQQRLLIRFPERRI